MGSSEKKPEEFDREAAYAFYVSEFQAPLVNSFMRRGAQRATAEDLTQVVFEKLLKRDDRDPISKNAAYIMKTANTVWIDHLRRRKAKPDREHAEFNEFAHSPESLGAERVIEGREALELAKNTLQALPERTRQIYLLFQVEGMKRKELARRLGITTSAIDKHLATAKTRLGQAFASAADDEESA